MTNTRVKRTTSDARCASPEAPLAPQPIYCVLDYPHKELLGVGTCAIFTGSDSIQAFKQFNARAQRLVTEHVKRTGERLGAPLCPKPIVLEVYQFEHTFTVHDESPEEAQSQVDGLEGRCFFAEIDNSLSIWVATNYKTDYAPWRSMIFCCASTLERARHLIYEELEALAGEEGRPLDDIVCFDLYSLRSDYAGETVVHFTGVDQPLVPKKLFDFVSTVKMVDPNRSPVATTHEGDGPDFTLPPPTIPMEDDASKPTPQIGVKRKCRASAGPAHSENALKRSDATLSFADAVSVDGDAKVENNATVTTSSMVVAAAESDNTEALLAEMHEFMKSEEKELVPTKKPRKSSSSKQPAAPKATTQEPEKKE